MDKCRVIICITNLGCDLNAAQLGLGKETKKRISERGRGAACEELDGFWRWLRIREFEARIREANKKRKMQRLRRKEGS